MTKHCRKSVMLNKGKVAVCPSITSIPCQRYPTAARCCKVIRRLRQHHWIDGRAPWKPITPSLYSREMPRIGQKILNTAFESYPNLIQPIRFISTPTSNKVISYLGRVNEVFWDLNKVAKLNRWGLNQCLHNVACSPPSGFVLQCDLD